MSTALAFAILLSAVSWAGAAERSWPGAPPDCWKEARIIHNSEFADLWKANTAFKKLPVGEVKPGVYSPNEGYYFIVENGRPHGAVTIFAEKPYLIRIEFSELFGLADVKWINEKLLFIRPWWGRIAATDLIYDVEAERVIYSDGVIDAYQAFLQYRESCPMNGCECIKKKSE